MRKLTNVYKPIDDTPSGLFEILIMSLSPFKRKISLLVQDTETISPYPSKPPIKACKEATEKEIIGITLTQCLHNMVLLTKVFTGF